MESPTYIPQSVVITFIMQDGTTAEGITFDDAGVAATIEQQLTLGTVVAYPVNRRGDVLPD